MTSDHDQTQPDTAADPGPEAGAASDEPEGSAFASHPNGDDSGVREAPQGEAAADSPEEDSDEGDGTDWDLLADADDRTPGQLLEALSGATAERDEYLDDLRRKQAEFDNFRKRMMRDGATQRITGHAEVAERLLDVLDDFDRTLEAAGDVDPGFVKGVTLVHDKLVRVLQDFGLRRIDDEGGVFDPNRHEAVQQIASDDDLDEPVVAQVLRPGYELGDRVLRPAMVAVTQ